MAKVGQQILLSPHTKEGVLALAVVRQEAQAEVARQLIEAQLPAMNAGHAGILNELWGALDAMKVGRLEALQEMTTVRTRPFLEGQPTRRPMRIADLKTAEGKWRASFPWHADAKPGKA